MIAYRSKRPPIFIPTASFSLGIASMPGQPRMMIDPTRRSIRRIQDTVASYYGLKQIDMVSQRRSRAVAWPRQVAMYLCRELTPHSLPSIGRYFGGRDHTTVMHAIRAVEQRRASRADASKIKELLAA